VWNGALSMSEFSPVGLFDPVSWRKSRWIIVRARIIKGSRKWKAKNRVSVAFLIENPPQSHCTSVGPT